jgi:hypothetical protein
MQSVRIPDGPNGGLRAGDRSTRSYSGPEVGFWEIALQARSSVGLAPINARAASAYVRATSGQRLRELRCVSENKFSQDAFPYFGDEPMAAPTIPERITPLYAATHDMQSVSRTKTPASPQGRGFSVKRSQLHLDLSYGPVTVIVTGNEVEVR